MSIDRRTVTTGLAWAAPAAALTVAAPAAAASEPCGWRCEGESGGTGS